MPSSSSTPSNNRLLLRLFPFATTTNHRPRPPAPSPPLLAIMWSPPFSLLMLAGLTCCCVSLPQIQYVNDKPFHLMQQTECKGGKIYEINDVQDIDECKSACFHRNCRAVNLYQIGEFRFKCEILAYVHGYIPAQGAACYISYY